MYNDKISWSIPTLATAAIFTVVYFISVFLGNVELSFIRFGGNFLLGCAIGYVVWLLVDD